MGQGSFRSVSLVPGDTVIVSASPIPGNEELVNHTLDDLFRLGANVLYDQVLDVHVSGHASQEEQKMMINLIRPKYFVPIHGEYRHLILHGRLAEQCAVDRSNIFIMETGDVLELDDSGAEIVDRVSDSYVFVDGLGVGDVGRSVLEARTRLSRDGFLVAQVTLDSDTGRLVGEPQIITRGFVYEQEATELLEQAKQEAIKAVEFGGTRSEISRRLEKYLARFALKETGRRPTIVPIVIRV